MTCVASPIDLLDRTRLGLRPRVQTLCLPTAFALVWIVSLSRNLFDPIGFDQAFYQFITERAMAGDRLYVDLWDQNAPGIVGVHWLATHLFGRSPASLRVFDACWQFLTLAALLTLCGRDRRRWQVGWLAATLYALAYYSTGYIHTAQREGFAVLPLLLAAHAATPSASHSARRLTCAAFHFFAGFMGFCAFAIKPPLGLCFGVLWLRALADACRRRRDGPAALAAVTGLTAGFTLAAAAGTVLLIRLEWWSGFWPVLIRADVPGYIRSPALIAGLIPYLAPAAVLLGAITWYALSTGGRWRDAGPISRYRVWARWAVAGGFVFAMILTIHRWFAWQQSILPYAGLLLPAVGAVLICPWSGRSHLWRTQLLLASASLAAVVLQGHFYRYHLFPLFAFTAGLSANELIDRFARFNDKNESARAWAVVCLAATLHLAVSAWGWTMTFYTRSPYVLAGTSLSGHYTRVTRHKTRFPTYATTARTAERVRTLTAESDPIACLIDEPRIYLLARRPPVYRLLRTQTCYRHMFPDYIRAICRSRPKLLLARVPPASAGEKDPAAVPSAVFEDLESHFGPAARAIRDLYQVTEVIDNRVCLLQPIPREKAVRLKHRAPRPTARCRG